MRLSYRGSVNIEVPDLSDYDVLNAAEKLQLEESAGLYKNEWADMEMALRKRQARIKQEVERGVDTYWLSKPLRTGVGHKHNLRLEGGGMTASVILLLFNITISWGDEGLRPENFQREY